MSASPAQRQAAAERAAKCVKLAADGLSRSAIAARLGIHSSEVGKLIKRAVEEKVDCQVAGGAGDDYDPKLVRRSA